MAEVSWPWVDEWIGTDPQWEDLFGHLPAGVKMYQADDGLAATVGPGITDVTIGTGGAMLAGRHYDSGAGAAISSIPNAGGGAARTDRLVLEVNRNAPGDDAIKVVKIAGTAGAGAPSIFSPPSGKTYLPLCAVTRRTSATTILQSDIRDERWKLNRCGGLSCNSSLRPPPQEGQIFREYDTGAVLVYAGSGYVALLGAGSRRAFVPGGFQQYTGGAICSTDKGGNLYANLNADTLGGVYIPNEDGHVYRVEASAIATQVTGNTWGQLMLVNNDGGFIRDGKPTAGQDAQSGNRPVGIPDIARGDWLIEGTGGDQYAVKLGVRKLGGSWNFELGGTGRNPAEFIVTDLGLY